MIEAVRRFLRKRKLREQMFLSYVVVGLLPFLIFSFCIIQMTNRQLEESLNKSLDSVFHSSYTSLEQKVEKVENAMDIIAMDSNMASILNTEYQSSYEKYTDITGYFDSFITAVMVANPEITQFEFYVNDSLAGIRQNFHPLAEVEEFEGFAEFSASIEAQWYYVDGQFVVMQKIYTPLMDGHFAVMAAWLPYDRVVDPQTFETLPYSVTLRGTAIEEASLSDGTRTRSRSGEIMNGAGTLELYIEGGLYSSTLLIVFGGIFAAFLLLLVTINRFAGGFASRIRAINRTLSETVRNNFSVTFSEEYQDEIGDLTVMLNRMIRDTKKLIQDVYESRIKEQEYEMKALQAQINPHFLYNTLSAINWHALSTENSEISDIVSSLSKFYRTALNRGSNVTTVGNELENIRAYLRIQQKIHNNSFDVAYEIEESVLPCRMPNLIIQPIAENAIEHGLDQKVEGRGKLWIRVRRDGASLLVEIADNGPGIAGGSLEDLLAQDSKGYGLQNVDKRLRIFYGEKYYMKYFYRDGAVFQLFLPD